MNADGGDVDMLYLVRCMWHIAPFWNTESMLKGSLNMAATRPYQKNYRSK